MAIGTRLKNIPKAVLDAGITRAMIDRALGQSAMVRAATIKKSKEVAEYWEGIAPVFGDKPPHRSEPAFGNIGDYKNSIHIKLRTHRSGYLTGQVSNTDPKAHWLEYGSAHNPEYGYMQRVKDHFDLG